ncbi:beta-1,4-N-acetylglucosamine oligosaccharide 6-O-sulfotransferase NodH [Rhizobium tibeticum]|uniref:Beta-1,4-N-acetylglucosamine oligosaccharide 6-O-sulfotransferase NodH n=1 Tax=Rhizobium tibeticum TaxID=501024 RepID=A0A1H8WMQ7_9HYPH|nr:sulfotransferase [Rhizobium tibeticum]SEI20594.1 Sulfotransferase domain protein [Rhizobium tibeticum]SEP28717.1 beta-1,4-N-acetylglucosamine oligosaccharide 6-O-sulfotransferase NodH [Rhizobium tibeticum]
MTQSTLSPEPFAILAMPRTGTHYLEECLNEHPNVLSNGELLNTYDTNWPDQERLLLSDRELLERAFMRYPLRSDKKVTHVGCKINEPQFQERPGFFAELAAWPGLKIILVIRRNTLESLRSLVQARQTRQWLKFDSDNAAPPPPVTLSFATCEAYFKAADDFHARVVNAVDSSKIHLIEYERLLRDPHACMATILDFLGAPAMQLSDRGILRRQEMRPLDQTVRNFHELRVHFAHGPYASYFELGKELAPFV